MASTTLEPMPEPDVLRVSILNEESIAVGFHLTEFVIRETLAAAPCSTYVLITDTNLARLYLNDFEQRFAAIAASLLQSTTITSQPCLLTYVLPPGETTKSRAIKGEIEDFLLDNGCTRDTCLIAMGGGVIGDLIGFVAATFMRGVPFIQLPTSLLAMVDSSIGGKTAIDTRHGKNLIGAFWQPRRLFIDLAYLNTLPEREFANGMAEVIKTAAIWSEEDFCKLENGAHAIKDAVFGHRTNSQENRWQGAKINDRSKAQSLLLDVILGSARVKAHVVTVDERESGLRGLLNFGHSIGHAIEAIYTPRLLHGECVSLGIVREAELARQLGHLNQVAVGRLVRCLTAYQLPVSLESDKRVHKLIGITDEQDICSTEDILRNMELDKKNIGKQKRIVLLSGIGRTLEPRASPVSDEDIRRVLSAAVLVQPIAATQVDPTNVYTVTVPGSKSISNRALILAALGTGTCRLTNLLHSDDTQVMLNALQQLGGAQFEWEDNGETLVVHGNGGRALHIPDEALYLGNAGTAARFLTGVATLVPATKTASITLTGNARMKQRPIAPLVDALKQNGVNIEYGETVGCLPLIITPPSTSDGLHPLRGGRIQLAASISSQYVSSILLCAPYASGEAITLELVGGAVISQPYIDMTIAMMKSFGVDVERISETVYRIPQGTYQNPAIYAIESDASSATYPLAIAAISGRTCRIDNIGTASLQGDARFASDVLAPMGCEVEQTATTTLVRGPPIGELKSVANLDMEPMTDAFLTASVLAAVASSDSNNHRTRIYGIANQRVKECNRIEAMRVELSKFGVTCEEFDDGIIVNGRPIAELTPPQEGVHCYDDHRVAMSFSVLASGLSSKHQGTIIREKRCVEKTWPTWWDDLVRQLDGKVYGANLPDHQQQLRQQNTTQDASIILIGMRGAGKTTLGRDASLILSDWQFIDMDDLLEKRLGITIPQLIETRGWPAFREEETQLLGEVITAKESCRRTVIACGGGVVESPAAQQLLAKYTGPIVYVQRSIDNICQYLDIDKTRPAYKQGHGSPRDVYEKRAPLYEQCSQYTFWIEGEDRAKVSKDWARFLQFITGQTITPSLYAQFKYFISLTFPDIRSITQDQFDTVTEGANAIELRVDLLDYPRGEHVTIREVEEAILLQVTHLRWLTSLPIIYTVRTASQGGQFPDNQAELYERLCRLGLRVGCEFVDIELNAADLSVSKTARLLTQQRGLTRVIASYHDIAGKLWHESSSGSNQFGQFTEIIKQLADYGDIVKVISVATNMAHNFTLHEWTRHATTQQLLNTRPLIAMNMGETGRLSRVVNCTLTPVTHAELPIRAAPGQVSIQEIHRLQHQLGVLPQREFYLFGSPISTSPSPLLHNTGFATLGLPYRYGLRELSNVVDNEDTIQAILSDKQFGGASVTIPLKVDIISLLDAISPAAQAIGAVNTIVTRKDNTKFGDNTDWLGIFHNIKQKPVLFSSKLSAALVIGAGGTARAAIYAAHQLGISHIYLYNRTRSNAEQLAQHFADLPITVVDDFNTVITATTSSLLRLQLIISTVPGNASTTLPLGLFTATNNLGGVAVELAYRPRKTILLETAAQHTGWFEVAGVDVLIEQGFWQFRHWTGCEPPQHIMAKQVHEAYIASE
ncbi:EPSP synthase-domain-containing protein [Syncephalis fuscata]|nr:EPSP synthase-domain-containing protein [Syncephalis fuscata]